MEKFYVKTKNNVKGQALLEALIAFAIAISVISTVTIITLSSLKNTQVSKHQNLSSQYAQEGMDIIRQMRDSYQLPDPVGLQTYCLGPDKKLVPVGATHDCEAKIAGMYIRKVIIEKGATNCSVLPTQTIATPVPPLPTATPAVMQGIVKTTVIVAWADGSCTNSSTYCRNVSLHSCLSQTEFKTLVLAPTSTSTPIPSPTPTPVPSLTLVGSASTGTKPYSVFVSGDFAYVTNAASPYTLKKFNISGNNPVLMGSTSTGGAPYANRVFVSGDFAYVTAGNTLQQFGINGNDPVLLGSVSTGGIANSVFVSGDFAYVIATSPNTLQKFNITGTYPVLLGSVSTGGIANSVFVSGDFAYVIAAASLQKYNITGDDPVLLGSVTPGDFPNSVFVSGDFAYVTNAASPYTLKKYTINSGNNPVLYGSVATTTYSPSVFVSGDFAYITGASLQKFRISGVPVFVDSVAGGGFSYSVFVSGGFVYRTNDTTSTLQKFTQ